jgi:hypothetical protein
MAQAQEIDLAISLLRGHHKEHAKELLRAHGLAVSGSWDELEYRLRNGVRKGTLPFEALVATLDAVEEHGHHHVFMYELPDELRPGLGVRRVEKLVKQEGLDGVYNVRTRVVDMPSTRVCTSVRYNGELLRLKWVVRREWEERIESGDRIEGSVHWRKFERHEARAVNTIGIDLSSSTVELRISDAGKQSRKDYQQSHAEYTDLTAWLLDWEGLDPVLMLHALPRIQQAQEEVKVREDTYLTADGAKAKWTSSATDKDVRDDTAYRASDRASRAGLDHRLLNVKWLPAEGVPLEREIHTYLYADGLGNEVRFPAACSEDEEAYVLSRIRHFAQP